MFKVYDNKTSQDCSNKDIDATEDGKERGANKKDRSDPKNKSEASEGKVERKKKT